MNDVILFVVGILVGAMNAVAGGGMLIGFPVLIASGLPPIVANATSSIIVLPGNIAASFAYRKYLRKVPRRYLLLLIPAVIGCVIGTLLLRNTSPERFEGIIPYLIFFAVVLFAYQPFLYRYIKEHIHGPKRFRESIRPMYIVAAAVLPLSIYGGYFGAGFGFIMLAFLGFTGLHDHIHRMNALKNITVIFISLTSLICLLGSGLIDWRHGLVMGGGNLIGGYGASVLAQKVSSHAIRVVVITIGFSTAGYLLIHGY